MLTTVSSFLYDIWLETRFYYCQPFKRTYKFTMGLIPNDWKHLLKTETSQKKKKSLLRHYILIKVLEK